MREEQDLPKKDDFIEEQLERSKKLLKDYIKFKEKEKEKCNDSGNR